MNQRRTKANKHFRLMYWSLLSLLIVHLFSHSAFGPHAHMRLFHLTMSGHHLSETTSAHVVHECDGCTPHHEGTALPDHSHELEEVHKATVPASSQARVPLQLFPTYVRVDAESVISLGSVFPSAGSPASFSPCPLYLQHTILLI